MFTSREQVAAAVRTDHFDKIIVSCSGGKDSIAAALTVLEAGADPDKVELWHQNVDGGPEAGQSGYKADWPVTPAYVRAAGAAMGLKVRFQWREGGFHREMERDNQTTGGVYFEDDKGVLQYLPPSKLATLGTRRKFPQISADLSVRWCSAALKINVFSRALNNSPDLKEAKVLVITGERREESANRAKYKELEVHRSNTQSRQVWQWRSVIDLTEAEVWGLMRRHRIRPNPVYYLGFGRLSCALCIFADADQWATLGVVMPDRVLTAAGNEARYKTTIRKGLTVLDQMGQGTPYPQAADPALVAAAMSEHYDPSRFYLAPGEEWVTPAGAFKRCGGPS